MPPRLVLFDLGNVVLRLKTDEHLTKLSAACAPGVTPADLLQALRDPRGPHEDYEIGRLDSRGFHAALRSRFGLTLGYEAWLALWSDYFLPNRPMDALLAKLRGQVRLAALSNTNAEHLAHIKHHYRVLDAFERLFASHELKLTKPDPAIFLHVLRELSVLPAETFYIDDAPQHVAAARGLGLTTFHYTYNDRELREALRGQGLSIPEGTGAAGGYC